MKTFEELSNVEKAKLLHEWFPAEMSMLVKYVGNVAHVIEEEQEANRNSWSNSFMTFEFWLTIVASIDDAIKKYGNKLEQRSSLFADQLFDGYNALFLIYCLQGYTKIRKQENIKFTAAVELLFM